MSSQASLTLDEKQRRNPRRKERKEKVTERKKKPEEGCAGRESGWGWEREAGESERTKIKGLKYREEGPRGGVAMS